MYKRGFVGFCIILVLLVISVFAGGEVSEDVGGDNITISWNFSGDIYEYLTTERPVEFNLTLFNQSADSFLSNTSAQCFLNASTHEDLITLNYSDNSNNFFTQIQYTEIQPNAHFNFLCNSSSFSLPTPKQNFYVSQNFLPIAITEFIENNTIVENITFYSWINQTIYVELRNVSNVLKGASYSLVSNAQCLLNVSNVEYSLINNTRHNTSIYQNDSVYFDSYGNFETFLSCNYSDETYTWLQNVSVNEYRPKFVSSTNLGDIFDNSKPVSLILNNNNLFSLHNQDNYSYYNYNNYFNLIYSNLTSSINRRSILSLVMEETLLNFGPFNSLGRFHNIQDQDDSIELNNSVFGDAENSFLTTFDTNNDGDFESLVFFDKSGLKNYKLKKNGTYQDLDILGMQSGFICYGDINSNGFYDILVTGADGDFDVVNLSLFTNNGELFSHNATFPFGFSDGSCHISKFLENDEINYLFTGMNISFQNQIILFNSTQKLLNNQPDPNTAQRIPIEPLSHSDIVVADFDNSGYKDIIICGQNQTGDAKTYFLKQNMTNPGYFYILNEFPHPNVEKCSISVSHLDNSSTPEIAIGGIGGDDKIKVYFTQPPRFKENTYKPNITKIEHNETTNQTFISWNQTKPIHSYNLKISYLNGTEIMSGFYPISTHPAQGYLGNMRYRTNVTLHNIKSPLVTVSVQSIDEALRKSEWSTLTSECEPPTDSSIWEISGFCPTTRQTLEPYNITIQESGTLHIQASQFTSEQTNITNYGTFVVNNITINSYTHNSTKNLSNLNITGKSILNTDITIQNSHFSNVTITANVSFIDTTADLLEVTGTLNNYITTIFVYQNQFQENLTNVEQNVTGTVTTNTTQVLLERIHLGSEIENKSYNTTFNKSLHYQKNKVIQPNQTILIQLRRTPEPIIASTFTLGTNVTALLTENESEDLANLSNLNNFSIGIENIGFIQWDEPVNISYLNLSNYIQIQHNSIFVNHSNLNKKANITFFNLTYEQTPTLLRDGVFCENCSNYIYHQQNFTTTVQGFSNYTTEPNAFITYNSPSLIIEDQNYTISVQYLQTNTSEFITDANCQFIDNSTTTLLSQNESFYMNTTLYSEATNNFNVTISCSASNFEPVNLTQSLRVVGEGLYYLRTDDVFEGVSGTSVGFYVGDIYYHGIANNILSQFLNKELEETSFTLRNRIPFSLTDLNNDGQIQKVKATDSILPISGIEAFITADFDKEGDIDIIYCGNNKFGILENRYAQNKHKEESFNPISLNQYGLSQCSLTYTKINNSYYITAQGESQDGNSTLYLFTTDTNLNLTKLNQTQGLQQGELLFVNIKNNQNPYLISTGYEDDLNSANTTIYTIQNNQLQLADIQINETYYHNSITYTTLPNQTYPIIIISDQNKINAYQYNTTHLIKNNTLIQDIEPFARGSAIFADTNNNNIPELFITGNNKAELYYLFDTSQDITNTKPQAPTITNAIYNNNTLHIEWTQIPNATYQLMVGEVAKPHRFVSGNTGSSTNPTQNQLGNMFTQTNVTLNNMPNTCFQIRVKAISNSYIYSNWSEVYQENQRNIAQYGKKDYDINCDGEYDYLERDDGSSNTITSSVQIGTAPTITPPPENVITNENDENSNEETPPEQPTQQPQSSSFTTTNWEIFTEVDHLNQNTKVTHKIQNNRRTTQYDIQATIEFPTNILTHANQLTTNTKHEILRQNPIIQFQKDQLNYLEQFTIIYTIPGIQNEKQIKQIPIQINANSQLTQKQIEEQDQLKEEKASQSIQTNITENVIDNQTEFKISLDLFENTDVVRDVEIEQYIPKCILEEIDESILRAGIDPKYINDVRIKEADPIIVWNFKELREGQELILRLDSFRPEDCDDEAKIRTLAGAFILQSYEINQENLQKALISTFLTILLFITLFILITKDHYKHEDPQVHRLTKIYLHKLHRGIPKEQILEEFKESKELDEHIQELQNHLENKQTHPFFFHLSERSVEIFLFVTLLVLNTLEFTGAIPGYVDWFKKIISWMLLLLIFYKADLTKIFFNHSKQYLNLLLLLGMFFIHLKSLVTFAQRLFLQDDITFIADLYKFIITYQIYFTDYLFYAGIIILALCAYLITKTIEIREGSFYFIFTTYAKPKGTTQFIKRIIKIFILLLIFQFTIFNRIIEWLAISIDSAIFIIALIILATMILSTRINANHRILSTLTAVLTNNATIITLAIFYLAAIIKPLLPQNITVFPILITVLAIITIAIIIQNIKQHFSGLQKISTAVESIYAKFIKLFQHPNTIYLGFSGLFILQQIVEIGLFIIPNITGQVSEIYSIQSHQTLFALFSHSGMVAQQLFGLPIGEQIAYLTLYTVALAGNFLLFFIPIYIWIVYFTHRGHPSTSFSLTGFFSSHTKLAKIGRTLMYIGLPSITISIVTQILQINSIQSFTDTAFNSANDIGISMGAQLITWNLVTVLYVLALTITICVFLYALFHTKFKSIPIYATLFSTLIAGIYTYTIPYMQSQVVYIQYLIINITEIGFSKQILTALTIFLASIDIFILYGLGLALVLYLHFPTPFKKRIINFISHRAFSQRVFFLSNTMHYLPYYDDVKSHLGGNIVHKVEKYIHRELDHNHHAETIIFQLKIHKYPDHIIKDALHKILHAKNIIDEIEHLHPSALRISKVQELAKKIEKENRPFDQIYEEYEQQYTHIEIKLAYRLAKNHYHQQLTPKTVEKIELHQIKRLMQIIQQLQDKNNTQNEILDLLTDQGEDPELVVHILQTQTRQKHKVHDIVQKLKNNISIKQLVAQDYHPQDIYVALEYILTHEPKKHLHQKNIKKYAESKQKVQALRQKGYSDKYIESYLQKHGWKDEQIVIVMQQVNEDTADHLAKIIEHEYFEIITMK